MRGLRFLAGLLVALTLQTLFNQFWPGALAYFDPYLIAVTYYAMGGNVTGTILAGSIAGLVQDAFSSSIFGVHAFTLTLCGYLVAYTWSRLLLAGNLAFGASLLASVVLGEFVVAVLLRILVLQEILIPVQRLILKGIFTTLAGMLLYQTIVVVFPPGARSERRRLW